MSISREFVLAGQSIFTIEVPPGLKSSTGKPAASHYTYLVEKVEASEKWPEAYFVRFLAGPDNNSDYLYLGKLCPHTGQLSKTTKSPIAFGVMLRVRLLNRVLAKVWEGDHAAYEEHGYATHHEGKCGRCGRRLTVPLSVTTGIGPECAKALGMELPTQLPPVETNGKGEPTRVAKERAAKKAAKVRKPEKPAPVVLEVSEHPEIDVSRLAATRDDEGEIVYWVGKYNGTEITVLND